MEPVSVPYPTVQHRSMLSTVLISQKLAFVPPPVLLCPTHFIMVQLRVEAAEWSSGTMEEFTFDSPRFIWPALWTEIIHQGPIPELSPISAPHSCQPILLNCISQLFKRGSRRNIKSHFGAFNHQWALMSNWNPWLKYLSTFHFLTKIAGIFCGVKVDATFLCNWSDLEYAFVGV